MKKTTIADDNKEQNSKMKQNRAAALAMSALVFALAASSIGNAYAFSVDSTRFARPYPATAIVGTTNAFHGSNTNSRKRNLVRLHEMPDEIDEIDENTNAQRPMSTRSSSSNPIQNLLVAAAFVTATLDPTNAAFATDNNNNNNNNNDLNLVSPGTPTIYTKTNSGDLSKVIASTESTVNKVVDTALLNGSNRKQLTESVKRIQSSITTELTSVQAWKEVTQILKDYGVDLQKETTVLVRPPSDWKRTFEDATSSKINVLVNGEIMQIELEHIQNTNTKKSLEAGEPILPDDEWVLRVKGYKGFDPTAPVKIDKPTLYSRQRPEWFRKINSYWNAPLQSSNAVVKTRGDVIVLGGAATITLSYALSYAYYVDQIEKEAAAAKEKQAAIAAKKKKQAAAKKKVASKDETPKKGWLGKKKTEPKSKAKTAPMEVDKPKTETTKAVEPNKKETAEKKKEEETQKEETPAAVAPEPKKVEKKSETKEPTKPKPAKEAPKPVEAAKTPAPAPASAPAPKPVKSDPPLAVDDDEEEEDNVKVVIDFDKDGKVVIKLDNDDMKTKRGGILDFAQALYLPWLGWFVSSSPTLDDRKTVIRFTQALLCPWAGIFFPKDWSTTPVQFDKDNKDDNP